jgi:hypothetical protein
MDQTLENPRAVLGDNEPPLAKVISEQEDFAQTVTDFLNDEFAERPKTVAELLDEARNLPPEIVDDATRAPYPGVIKRIRDEAKLLVALQEKEKTPYLRGGQAVDQFFFGLIDRLARRDKKNKPGAADVLNSRLTAYDTKVLEERQAEARRIAQEAERVAREAQEKAYREAREAEEKRLAAERARKPEIVEQKAAVANAAEVAASSAAAAAAIAANQAEAAHVDTLRKASDIMRDRGGDGTLTTMATEPYAEIEDESKLDRNALWPFINLDAKERALRAWSKNTGYTKQMDGAKIGKRPKSVVR